MSVCNPPKIGTAKGKSDYTKVSFVPDYARFGMSGWFCFVIIRN